MRDQGVKRHVKMHDLKRATRYLALRAFLPGADSTGL